MGNRIKGRWIPTGTVCGEDFDLTPHLNGRIKHCYICKRERGRGGMFLTGKGEYDFDHSEVELRLLEVDLDNGQKYGFFLCNECCLLLKLYSKFITRYQLTYRVPNHVPRKIKKTLLYLRKRCTHRGKVNPERFWLCDIAYGVPEGYRHDSAVELISWLYLRELPVEKEWETIVEWNQLNQPPLSDQELKSIYESTRNRQVPQISPPMIEEVAEASQTD